MTVWAQYLFNSISSLASIAIVISLIFLVQQTRLFRQQTKANGETARAENHAGLREVMIKINEVFLDKPEIRRYFYDGVPIDTNSPDYAYAETVAEHLLDIMEHMLWQADTFPRLYGASEDDKLFWQVWDQYTIDMFLSSPLLRSYGQQKRNWYTHHIIDRLDRIQSILAKAND